jgi:hypothetical protein
VFLKDFGSSAHNYAGLRKEGMCGGIGGGKKTKRKEEEEQEQVDNDLEKEEMNE